MRFMVTGMPLLPGWAALTLVIALAVVGLAHVRHARAMTGERRWWHAGHVVMAAGMIVMCLVPRDGSAGVYWAGAGVFGGLCAVAAAGAFAAWHRDARPSWLWAATTADMAAMAYMSLPAAARPTLLSYLLVTYLCVEALLWALAPSRRPSLRIRATLVVMSAAMAWMLIAMQEMNLTPGSPGGPMRM